MALQLVVSGIAHGAKEHGVSLLREPERGFGQRVAAGGVGRAAHGSFLHFKGHGQGFENFDSLGHDFGANAVARQKGDFHGALSLFRSGGKGERTPFASDFIAAGADLAGAGGGYAFKKRGKKGITPFQPL